MKVSLKVAGGLHQGKEIPMTGPHFLIGRDPECQLRPASPSVSKKHCALIVKKGRLFVKDFGSTNGTFVNGERVDGHAELKDGFELKAGPLEFVVVIEGQPAAVTEKEAGASAASALTVVDDDPAAVDLTPEEGEGKSGSDSERLAAILLGGGGDDDPSTVSEGDIPEGSTVFDMPALDADGNPIKKEEPKKEEPQDNAAAARELLRQYQQRPRR